MSFWAGPALKVMPFLGPLLVLVAVWSLVWKGMALWKSARRGEKVWFVVLLLVNTAGILEILYIYVFSRKAHPVETHHEHK